MKDRILAIIEQRIDAADVKGTPEGMADEIMAELQKTPMELSERDCTVTLHSSDVGSPNNRPVLKVMRQDKLIATLELNDFAGCAQWFFEGELRHNLNLDPESKQYQKRVKQVRKALGYAYP